jgi:Fe-S-cluster containining protein
MADLGSLCRACGLCCDGSLFGRAELETDEIDAARRHRLRVVGSGGSFEQPCTAYVDASCAVYEDRPRSCRRFVCKLHERARVEGGALDIYLERVARARKLLAHLDSSSAVPRELAALLVEDFARA